MNLFERSVELPLGRKDLIDLDEYRRCGPPQPHWMNGTADKLAYMEGYLARLLESAGGGYLVYVGRAQDRATAMLVPDSDLSGLSYS